MDVFIDWVFARLFAEFDDEAAKQLSCRLGLPGSWLVVLISERTPLTGRIPWVLQLAREVMAPGLYAVLPVRYGPADWPLPQPLAGHPRIEELDDDLCVIARGSRPPIPLSRWLRPPV